MAAARPKLGRPKGSYTQFRRIKQLQEKLELSPKGLTLSEIAKLLHVTPRSVRRYLKELEREVDLERTPDPDGYAGLTIKIPTRDLPRRVKLHRTQIYGLLMARRMFGILEGSVFEAALRDAFDNLLSHVRRAPRRGATLDPDTRLEERFLYLPAIPAEPLNEEQAETLDILIDACAQLRITEIEYKKPGGSWEPLTIHPYATVLYKETLYVVAFVKERDAIRTLRMDRMRDANADPLAQFHLPEDFSVDRYFSGQFGVHVGGDKVRVVVEFDESVRGLVGGRIYPGEDGEPGLVQDLPGGGLRVTMFAGASAEVLSWVLGFGSQAKVIEPQSLAEDVCRELEASLAHYLEGASRVGAPQGTSFSELGGRRART